MIKILHVLGRLGSGGAESLVMSVYRKIDTSKIQFDFLTRGDNNEKIVIEVEKLGGKVINIPKFPQKVIENYSEISNFFKYNHKNYNIVHVHANSLVYLKPMLEAKKYNMKVILHSHNTQAANPFFNIIHYINRKKVKGLCDFRIACSSNAGKWMFSDNEFIFLKNAIDLKKYQYDKESRDKIRKNLDISNKLVIGHVGRFVTQKNHKFLIEIYEAFQKKYPNTCLLLIGEGELEEKVRRLVKKKKLEKDVYFLGEKDNVEIYMQAMDYFLFPSRFEGLGIVLIEAQASGLPIVTSKIISSEALIDKENIFIVDSNNDLEAWVKKMEECKESKNERKDNVELLKSEGYDIEEMSQFLVEIYRQVIA